MLCHLRLQLAVARGSRHMMLNGHLHTLRPTVVGGTSFPRALLLCDCAVRD
jgi:hypothetical protein